MRDPVGAPGSVTAPAAAAPALQQGMGPTPRPAGTAAGHGTRLPTVGGRFLRFALVGASGVVVNGLALLLAVEAFGWPVLGASLLSIELSTLSNWFLNRHWTWRDRDDSWRHSLLAYHGVSAVGMAIQWTVLAIVVAGTDWHYLVGTVLGVAAATSWNFAGNHLLAFRDRTAPPLPRWALYATSAFVQLVIAAVFAHPWDTFVFQRSVEDLLLRGLTPYQVAEAAPAYTYWGGSLPALPMWYAYPPIPLALMTASYFPSALGWLPGEWLGRVLVRLPFIAATLGLAALARHALRTAPGPTREAPARERRAATAERLLLLNPLLLVIAALWGQFEALVLVLLLAMVLALRTRSCAKAGAWWALAVCVKIFPLYLVPLLALHLHRTSGRKAVIRFAAASLAVGAAINLPFLVLSPRGFLQQVVLMHGQRSPARLAPLSYLDNFLELLSESFPAHLPPAGVWSAWLGVVSLVLVTATIAAVAAASRRAPANEGQLLHWMALTFLAGLLATKVLNEQYLVLPLGLLLVARAHPQRTMPQGVGRFVALGSWAVVAAGMLGGLNIINAVPAPIAQAVFGDLAPATVAKLAAAFGLTASQLKALLAWLTGLFLLAPLALALRRLAPAVRVGLMDLERGGLRWARRMGGAVAPRRPTRPILVGAAVLVLCTAPLGVALAGGLANEAVPQPLATGDRWVLASIRTDWYNPSNDMERAEGTWQGVTLQPQAGFYNPNAHKLGNDLALVRAAGFDGIVIEVHPHHPGPADTLRRVAERAGVPYALGIDVADLQGHPLALEASTARQLRQLLNSPTVDYWQGRGHIVDPTGDERLVFLSGTAAVQPRFTPGELRFVRDAWLATSPPAGAVAVLDAGLAPASLDDLGRDDALGALWRAAYGAARAAWWHAALPGHLAYLVDGDVPGPQVLGPSAANQPSGLDVAPGAVRFTTLHGILAPDHVRSAFAQAQWTGANGVLVPWNDHRGGTAVEPMARHGDATLRETARWIASFHAAREQEPAEQPTRSAVAWTQQQVEHAVGDPARPLLQVE